MPLKKSLVSEERAQFVLAYEGNRLAGYVVAFGSVARALTRGLSGMAQGEYRPLGTGHIGLIIRKKGAGSNRLYEGNSREIRPLPVLVQTGC
jgi:hypothetical protein